MNDEEINSRLQNLLHVEMDFLVRDVYEYFFAHLKICIRSTNEDVGNG